MNLTDSEREELKTRIVNECAEKLMSETVGSFSQTMEDRLSNQIVSTVAPKLSDQFMHENKSKILESEALEIDRIAALITADTVRRIARKLFDNDY